MSSDDPEIDPTEKEEAAAKIAQEQWKLYQEIFVPYENAQIQKMTGYDPTTGQWTGEGYNSQEYYNQATGAANTAVQSSFSSALENDLKAAAAAGLNPNSGGFDKIINDSQLGRQESQAKQKGVAQQAVQDKYLSGLGAVAAMGAGQSVEAQAGMNQIAAQSAQESISDAQSSAYESAATGQALATGAGAAAGYKYG